MAEFETNLMIAPVEEGYIDMDSVLDDEDGFKKIAVFKL